MENKRILFTNLSLDSYLTNLSHKRNVQLDIIKIESENTANTNPGYIVMRVLTTNLMLKSIRLRAPLLKKK